MKERKRKAKLREDTVVIALRDMQWRKQFEKAGRKAIRSIAKLASDQRADGNLEGPIASSLRASVLQYSNPPGFIKLDGNAESKTADVALASAEGLCFLIEVKSERLAIRNEWKPPKKRKKSGTGQPASKAAYYRLQQLVQKRNEEQEINPSSGLNELIQSYRCHQVAYWDVWEDDTQQLVGGIRVEPYISACAEMRRPAEKAAQQHMEKPANFGSQFSRHGTANSPSDRVSANEIFHSDFGMNLKIRTGHADSKMYSLGLPYKEFQSYVNWLCAGHSTDGVASSQSIALCSPTKDFFRSFQTRASSQIYCRSRADHLVSRGLPLLKLFS